MSPERTSYHHGDLHEAIKDEALATIDRDGLGEVSLRGIARRLGVSEAAPYHHYSGKEELLAAVAADSYRGFHRRMIDALDRVGDDPFDRLAAVGRAYVEYGLANRGRFRLMFGEHMLSLETHADVIAAGRPTRALLSEVVGACVGDDTPDPLPIEQTTWALVHGITWLVTEAEILPNADTSDIDRLVDVAMSILSAGLRAVGR